MFYYKNMYKVLFLAIEEAKDKKKSVERQAKNLHWIGDQSVRSFFLFYLKIIIDLQMKRLK